MHMMPQEHHLSMGEHCRLGFFFQFFYLFSGVQNRLQNVDENIYIPITRAEFTVLNSAFNVGLISTCFALSVGPIWIDLPLQSQFVIPYFLGWHAFVESMKAEDGARSNGAGRSGAESEWGR